MVARLNKPTLFLNIANNWKHKPAIVRENLCKLKLQLWKQGVVMIPSLSSLAKKIVVMTNSGATNGGTVSTELCASENPARHAPEEKLYEHIFQQL